MQIFINGAIISIARVGWNNHLNYGQMQRWQPNQIFNYVLLFSRAEFLDLFSDAFAQQAAEFKQIDEEDGGEPTDFAAFNYGPLAKALGGGQSAALYHCFDDFMMTDHVLPAIFDPPGPAAFTINCLDRIATSVDRVMLEGRGYTRAEGIMRYEDWMDGKSPSDV
ncbi:MAG: hypothetical protein AAF198_02605 [Pseudomonadota bacterium]